MKIPFSNALCVKEDITELLKKSPLTRSRPKIYICSDSNNKNPNNNFHIFKRWLEKLADLKGLVLVYFDFSPYNTSQSVDHIDLSNQLYENLKEVIKDVDLVLAFGPDYYTNEIYMANICYKDIAIVMTKDPTEEDLLFYSLLLTCSPWVSFFPFSEDVPNTFAHLLKQYNLI